MLHLGLIWATFGTYGSLVGLATGHMCNGLACDNGPDVAQECLEGNQNEEYGPRLGDVWPSQITDMSCFCSYFFLLFVVILVLLSFCLTEKVEIWLSSICLDQTGQMQRCSFAGRLQFVLMSFLWPCRMRVAERGGVGGGKRPLSTEYLQWKAHRWPLVLLPLFSGCINLVFTELLNKDGTVSVNITDVHAVHPAAAHKKHNTAHNVDQTKKQRLLSCIDVYAH